MTRDLRQDLRDLEREVPVLSPASWTVRVAQAHRDGARLALRARVLATCAVLAVGLAALAPVLGPWRDRGADVPAVPAVSGPGTWPAQRPPDPSDPGSVRGLADSPIPRAAFLRTVLRRDTLPAGTASGAPIGPGGLGDVSADVYAYGADGQGWRRLPDVARASQSATGATAAMGVYQALSPDGTRAAGGGTFQEPLVIHTMTLATSRRRDYVLDTPDRFGSVGALSYSPDNRWLAIDLGRTRPQHSARHQLVVIDTRTGHCRVLAEEISGSPRWSADSRRISVVTGTSGRSARKPPTISVIDVADGSTRDVARLGAAAAVNAPLITPDGTGVVVALGTASGGVLRRYRLSGQLVAEVALRAPENTVLGWRAGQILVTSEGVALLDPRTGGRRELTTATGDALALGILGTARIG